MDSKHLKFILAIGLQLIVIFAIIIYKASILLTGTDIVLKVQPVDPRDFLRGDYVRLSYEINQLDLNKLEVEGDKDFKTGNQIYVELKKTNNYFSAKKVSRVKPDSKYFIKGAVASSYSNRLAAVYGIESYFMPEGKARDLEILLRGRSSADILIGLKVDKSGNALINKIIIAGQEIDAGDFKEVVSGAQLQTELQRQYYEQQIQQNERDRKREDNLWNLGKVLEIYYGTNNSYPAITGSSFPISELYSKLLDASVKSPIPGVVAGSLPDDPSSPDRHYAWVDNTGNPNGYCLFGISESYSQGGLPGYYLMTSNLSKDSKKRPKIKYLSSAPKTLEDCEVKKPIATIAGFAFIDKDGDLFFDKNENIFLDGEVRLVNNQGVIIQNIKLDKRLDSVIKNKGGSFQLEIYEPGLYSIQLKTELSFGFKVSNTFNNGVSKPIEIKGGEKITNYNFAVQF